MRIDGVAVDNSAKSVRVTTFTHWHRLQVSFRKVLGCYLHRPNVVDADLRQLSRCACRRECAVAEEDAPLAL
eukprot:2230603-Rhodomonas_salina.1